MVNYSAMSAQPTAELDRSFHALAHPVRRAIVGRLADGPATVREASRGAGVSKPAVTRHLRVLEDAGIVDRARTRAHARAHPAPRLPGRGVRWIDGHRRLWERKLNVIEAYLEESR